jgi:WD40 repeat protein
MRKCPSCQASLADKDLKAGKCPQCGSKLPLEGEGPPLDPGKATVSDMGGTADLTFLPAGQTPDAGKATVDESDIGKTVDASDIGKTIDESQGRKTIDELALRQTVDESTWAAQQAAGDKGQGTVDERHLKRTVHGSGKPRTVSEVGQTLDSAELSREEQERMNLLWADAVQPGARPGMTIKGHESISSSVAGNLTVQQRSLRMSADCKTSEADYELLDMLGEGGMGVVYTARQASINRTVALKMIKSHAASDETQRAKFLSEAVVTGELDHPNIVPIYDLGSNEHGALFYSMKRVEGTPWHKVIGQKSLSENLEILMKVADAIGFAHSRGVIHRDLKPENIMLGDYGEVLVMDWGLALPTADFGKHESVYASAGLGGTPAYMAPEMASGHGDEITTRSDIYLLGAILYEIVTGQPPHTGASTMTCLFNAAKNDIVSTTKTGELVDIALRAMATNPADRYATVGEFQNAIRDYMAHSESIALCARAEEDLAGARRSDNYEDYSRAVFAFEEALAMWEGNTRALRGSAAARLAYAQSALRKGDFDLGLSLIDPDNPEHADLQRRMLAAKRERDARQQRLKALKRIVVGGVAAFMVVVSGAAVWINIARQEAVRAKALAEISEKEAVKQKGIAEAQEKIAKDNEAKAVANELIAKEERDKALEAKKQEEIAKLAEVEERKKAEAAQLAEKKQREKAEAAQKAEEIAKLAEKKEREKAEAAQLAEKKQREKAEAAQKAEEIAKLAEIQQRKKAVKAQKEAEEAKEKEEYEAYIALIGLAAAKIEENAFGTARDLLLGCKEHLRNWEWGRLMHICQQDFKAFEPGARVEAVAFDRDGRRFVSGSWNGLARVWDITTGGVIDLPHEGMRVHAVAFSPDGQHVATGADDRLIRVWHIASRKVVQTCSGHEDTVLSVKFSRDGSRMLSASYDKTARLWDARSGQELKKFVGHTWWVWDAAFSPNETQIVTAGQDGIAIVWSLATAKPSPPFTGHQGPVYAAAFSPDGQTVATGGYDKRVLLWRPDDVAPYDYEKLVQGQKVQPPKYVAFDGHTAAVRSVAFSADGQRLSTGGHDNAVNLWHVGSGQLIKSLRGHDSWVRSCAFSPAGRFVLSGGFDPANPIRLWDVDGYEEVRILRGHVLRGHNDSVFSVGFSRQGDRLVTASRDRTAMTFDFLTGKPLQSFAEGHSYLAAQAAFFGGGKRLATSAIDNTVRLWDVSNGTQLRQLDFTGQTAALAVAHDTPQGHPGWLITGRDDSIAKNVAQVWHESGKPIKQLSGHRAAVNTIAVSRDNRLVFTGDEFGRGKLWEGGTWRELHAFESPGRHKFTAAAFLPDGSRLLTACLDKTVAQWDTRSGREVASLLLKHPDGVVALALTPRGDIAITSCQDGQVRLWDVNRASVLGTLPLRTSKDRVDAIDVSPDGRYAMTVNAVRGAVQLWDLATQKEVLVPTSADRFGPFLDFDALGGTVWSATFSPDGKSLVTVGGTTARLWDVQTTRQARTDRMSFSPNGAVAAAEFSPDGAQVVTGSWDNSARIWDSRDGKALKKLEGHKASVNSAVFSPEDGTLVLTASDDGTAILWNWRTGKSIRELRGHTDRVRSAVFSAKADYILTASYDQTARMWDARSGKLLQTFMGHKYGVLCGAFSPDATRVITGSEDNKAKIWDVNSGKEIVTLEGHTASVTSVAYSLDGRRVITGSDDYSAKLWDSSREHEKEGKQILNLKGHTQEITSVRFSHDGRYIATGSRDGTAMVWLTKQWQTNGRMAAAEKQ